MWAGQSQGSIRALPGGSELCIISSLFTIHDGMAVTIISKDRKMVCCSTVPGHRPSSCTFYGLESVSWKSILWATQTVSINLSLPFNIYKKPFPGERIWADYFPACGPGNNNKGMFCRRCTFPWLCNELLCPRRYDKWPGSGVILVITRSELHSAVTAQGLQWPARIFQDIKTFLDTM